jgi:SNF2 family DNA or RNA helicase
MEMMLSQGAVGLFLDPGLGKTSICLGALSVLKKHNYFKKALIVSPIRPMYSTWPAEVYKWDEFNEFTYVVLHGGEKTSRLREDVELYFINPEGLQWLFRQPNLPEWDTLVVDESTKFKDTRTQRFRALKGHLNKFRRRWILTGTPVPNGLMDLFGQIYILDRGRALGQYVTHFRNEFFMQTGWNKWGWSPQPGAFERIVDRISPLVLQLSAEEYLKMPELTFHDVEVELPEDVMEKYRAVEDDFVAMLGDQNLVAANAAAAGTKCRQIANGAVYVGEGEDRMWIPMHDAKLDALEDLLEELNGHPVLLLYEFRHDRERILARFPHAIDLKSGDIASVVERFNSGNIPLLIGHPASMGHGLNLQGSCHHVIWFGITWNLEYYDQAIARVYRQGQRSGIVRCYHIKARNTKDEDVLQVLTKKDRTQQDLLSAIKVHRRDNLGQFGGEGYPGLSSELEGNEVS